MVDNATNGTAEESAEVAEPKTRKSTSTRAKKVPVSSVVFSANDESTPTPEAAPAAAPMTALLFQQPDVSQAVRTRRTRKKAEDEANDSNGSSNESTNDSDDKSGSAKSRRSRSRTNSQIDADSQDSQDNSSNDSKDSDSGENQDSNKKRRRGSRGGRKNSDNDSQDKSADSIDSKNESKSNDSKNNKSKNDESKSDSNDNSNKNSDDSDEPTVRRRRRRRSSGDDANDEVTAPKGSTRLEAKRQRRKEGREAGRRRQTITESEYLARRESVDRDMLIREKDGLNQIAVIEDNVLVEHYVARHTQSSMVGNVYLGRVQNVLPSMEAAFVDIGKGRNAVLYAGEVNWEAAGMEGKPRKIEQALKSGDTVLVQVTKDPIGHKGARLTAQVTLAGRHLVLVPGGAMTGISRKLPERERNRLKKILKEVVPSEHGVIVRTAAEGATEEQLRQDVERLTKSWNDIQKKSTSTKNAPSLLKGEPELAVRVVRDIFNEDFKTLKISGENAWETISSYVEELSPELMDRLERWEDDKDIFQASRVDEQLAKAFDRKVFLPSGGSLVIDRTEAMTVVDVNTGKFTGTGGSLEETVTRNNLEAAEEIVRQLRLRDIGGIIVVDFIDMVLEANRDLVLRRLIECLGRDRTRHQVAEVTSLGLVQMTRKRVGQGLVEAFSTTCEACDGHGFITHEHPVEKNEDKGNQNQSRSNNNNKKNAQNQKKNNEPKQSEPDPKHEEVKAALANIAAAASSKHDGGKADDQDVDAKSDDQKSDHEAGEKKSTRQRRGRGNKADTPKDGALKDDAEKTDSPAASKAKADAPTADEKPAEKQADKAPGKPADEPAEKKAPAKRRVTSSGTITPTSSASSAIMSFPVKK